MPATEGIILNHTINPYTGIECDRLRDIANGQVQLSGTTVGSTATYSCSHGYFLVGTSKRVCGTDGDWSGKEPFCKCEFNVYLSRTF